MKENLIYLDTYVLQQDMRIRLPKSIIENMNVKQGESYFAIYLDKENDSLVLKIDTRKEERIKWTS